MGPQCCRGAAALFFVRVRVVGARRPVRRPLPPLRPPQKNSDGTPHRLTLVGHSPERLHSRQNLVESLGGPPLRCKSAHELYLCRMCGGASIKILISAALAPP